jgi:hypothetical protein
MLVQLNAEQTALYKEQEDANYHMSNLVLLAAVSGKFDMLDAALHLFRLWHRNREITDHFVIIRNNLSEQLKPVFHVSPKETEATQLEANN